MKKYYQKFLAFGFMAITSLTLLGCQPVDPKIDTLAACLTENGAIMFGSYTCPHCLDQKKDFGSSWDKINYVECNPKGPGYDKQKCEEYEISSVPAWYFRDGTKLVGRQSFEDLAKAASCEYVPNQN